MWHCDQLEKFPTFAEARFVEPAGAIGTAPQVRRVQYTLDVATHPTPGRWYDLVKDPDTGAESFTPAAPRAPPVLEAGAIPAAPAAPPPPPPQPAAAPADTTPTQPPA